METETRYKLPDGREVGEEDALEWVKNKALSEKRARENERKGIPAPEDRKSIDSGILFEPSFKYVGRRCRITATLGEPVWRCKRRVVLLDVRMVKGDTLLAHEITTHATQYFAHIGPWERGVRVAFTATIAKHTSHLNEYEPQLKLHKIHDLRVVV